MKIYPAIIEHRHGTDLYLGKSEDELKDKIYEYVDNWWTDELPLEDMPEDRDEAINNYFELVEGEFVTYFLPEDIAPSIVDWANSQEP